MQAAGRRRTSCVGFIKSDLEFILAQIKIAEQHALGFDLLTLLPNVARAVLACARSMARSTTWCRARANSAPPTPSLPAADRSGFPAMHRAGHPTQQTSGTVVDSQPRIISNLIVDQTANNPAAVAAADSAGADGIWGTADDVLNDGVPILRTVPALDGISGTADDVADLLVRQRDAGRGPVGAVQLCGSRSSASSSTTASTSSPRAAAARSSFRCKPDDPLIVGPMASRHCRRSAGAAASWC